MRIFSIRPKTMATQILAVACPVCHYEMDRTTALTGDDHTPSPGDITLCLKCGEIMRFDENLIMEAATLADLLDCTAEQSDMLRKAQAIIRRERWIK